MDLNKFSTTAQTDEVDFNNLPAQMGSFPDPPPPGSYRFEIPKSLSVANMDEDPNPDDPKKPFFYVKFDQNAPLQIVQSLGSKHDGEPFQTRISARPRKRGKEDDAPKVSDLSYLAQALGATTRPLSNKAWAEYLLTQAGKTFGADLEYGYYCNPKKNIYAEGEGGAVQEVEGQAGCGQRYYQKDVDKVNGVQPVRVQCQCGASLRANANLQRFRP